MEFSSKGLRSSVSPFPSETGVDWLRVHSTEFQVKVSHLLKVIPSQKQRSSILWDSDGEPIRGYMALWKGRGVNLRISPKYKHSQRVACWVTFCPKVILEGSNARIADQSEFRAALNEIEKILEKVGVEIKMGEAKLSRVEVARSVSFPRPFAAYLPYLQRVDIKRGRYARDYATSIIRGNKSQRLSVYDKRAQLQSRISNGMVPAEALEMLPAGQVARVEWQLRKASVVKSQLNLTTLDELHAFYPQLGDWLDAQLEKHLFPTPISSQGQLFDSTPLASRHDQWRAVLTEAGGKTDKIRALLAAQGFEAVATQMDTHPEVPNGAQNLSRLLREACVKSSNYSRLNQMLCQNRLSLFTPEGVPYSTLYRELHMAFLPRGAV